MARATALEEKTDGRSTGDSRDQTRREQLLRLELFKAQATLRASVRQRSRTSGQSAWYRTELAKARAQNKILAEQVDSLVHERADLLAELEDTNADLRSMNQELQALSPTPSGSTAEQRPVLSIVRSDPRRADAEQNGRGRREAPPAGRERAEGAP